MLVETLKSSSLTAGVTVEGEVVDSARRDTGDDVLDGKSLDTGGEGGGGSLTLKTLEVCSKTCNVRSSHGGTRDGVGTAVEPGGQNGNTGGDDVANGTEVREGRELVSVVASHDGEDGGLGGGG
jgi:hypothetical protein